MPRSTCPHCDRPVPDGGVCPACSLRLAAVEDPDDLPDREEVEQLVPDWEVLEFRRDREGIEAAVRHRRTSERGLFFFYRTAQKESAGQAAPDASRKNHPNLLKVFETVSEQGYHYEIREFFDGVLLPDAVKSGIVSRKRIVSEIVPQLQGLVRFARSNGLPTGVDPGGIRVDEKGKMKVLLRNDLESTEDDVLAWTRDLGTVGTRIGDYELRELLGEGGFAEVYLAEQRGDIRRTAALKILKPGMDTGEVLARFEAERQALARLNHPGIASIHDAGSSAEGRPYFVLEYVSGHSLTEFVDAANPGLNDKLALFRKICAAVEHAHEHGIIHRDLKPGNILVAEVAKTSEGRNFSRVPLPKIIDFGIAKATREPLTQQTLHTRFYHLVGSLAYMSPEQASMKSDVDERADVYALGCILYELLTGRTPLGGRTGELAPIEALTRIRDDFPPLPSKAAPPGRRISRDLDAVVMKALEKEPGRRYASVEAFAADIGRILAGEAVSVRAPGIGYRIRRLARDRRAKAAFYTFAGAAAVTAVAFALWPERQAEPKGLQPIHFVAKSRVADGHIVPVSLWNFDDTYENSIEGAPPVRVIGEPQLEFQPDEIGGELAQVLSFPKFLVTEYLTTDNPIGPNGHDFAEDTNEYTLVMDVMFPSFSKYTALMQAGVGNFGGCELAIDKGGVFASRQHRGQRIGAGQWVRVACAVSVRGTSQLVRLWVDGQPAGPAWPQGGIDGHIGLNEEVHFFADGDGNTAAGFVNSIALYDVALTEGEIEALGAASAEGIPASRKAVLQEATALEAVQLASAVIAPPEPGAESPTYEISLAGDRLLTSQSTSGAWNGGAWIYERTGRPKTNWQLTATLPPPQEVDEDWKFAVAISLNDSWAAVAAVDEPVDGHGLAGAVYLYRRQANGQWHFTQRLVSEDPAGGNKFGRRIRMGPHTMVIAERRKGEMTSHRANLFECAPGSNGEDAWKLAEVIDRPHSSLGAAAAFPDEETVFMKTEFGRFALFQKSSGEWREISEFEPEGDASLLGNALHSDGNTLLVGWPKPQSQHPGEVLVFRRNQGGPGAWGLAGSIPAPPTSPEPHHFGTEVAIDGDRAVVSGLTAGRKTVVIHQIQRLPSEGESWREVAIPLTVPGHALSSLVAAAATPFDGGRVLVFDMKRWASDHPYDFLGSQTGGTKAVAIEPPVTRPDRPNTEGLGEFLKGCNAALSWVDGKALFYKGADLIGLKMETHPYNTVGTGYPKPARRVWPDGFRPGIDAAVSWGKVAYCFNGNMFYKVRREPYPDSTIFPGYPKEITSEEWPGWPDDFCSGIDAAASWGEIAYFFKGSRYIKVHRKPWPENTMFSGYPKEITSGEWPDWPPAFRSGIDAAVAWTTGKAYFFHGSQYIRVDLKPWPENKMDPGYPKDISHLIHW
jgi:hypothetical protein